MANSLLLNANALNIPLADKSVQVCVTSPPYFSLRDYGVSGQLGLEPTPGEYVENMVRVFREVKRVLRDDGTLWLNLGDSYNGSGGAGGDYNAGGLREGQPRYPGHRVEGLKPKDLIGIPWRVAFALQADGWYLRSDIIWHKPNPMPESVTDRPTKAHEYMFLLTKSEKYFYDADAVREQTQAIQIEPKKNMKSGPLAGAHGSMGADGNGKRYDRVYNNPLGRNRRTVWTIPTAPYSGAHFATFPPALVEPCIKAGTSEAGCCATCGAPYKRVVEPTGHVNRREPAHVPGNSATKVDSTGWGPTRRPTETFRPTCDHDAPAVPCIVLDPFNGSGTTGLVCQQLGRRYIGLDLSMAYMQLSRERLGMVALEEWQNGKSADASDLTGLPLFAQD